MKNIRTLALGWILLVLGVAGCALPLLPGIPLILVALVLLSRRYTWAKRILARARRAFPELAAKLQQRWF